MEYIRGIITELRATNWISLRQLAFLLIYTILLCGIIALIIAGLDVTFRYIFNEIIHVPFI